MDPGIHCDSHCNASFVTTAGFGFGNLLDGIALAAWAVIQALPANPFPVFIKCILCPGIIPSFAFKEALGSYVHSFYQFLYAKLLRLFSCR